MRAINVNNISSRVLVRSSTYPIARFADRLEWDNATWWPSYDAALDEVLDCEVRGSLDTLKELTDWLDCENDQHLMTMNSWFSLFRQLHQRSVVNMIHDTSRITNLEWMWRFSCWKRSFRILVRLLFWQAKRKSEPSSSRMVTKTRGLKIMDSADKHFVCLSIQVWDTVKK